MKFPTKYINGVDGQKWFVLARSVKEAFHTYTLHLVAENGTREDLEYGFDDYFKLPNAVLNVEVAKINT